MKTVEPKTVSSTIQRKESGSFFKRDNRTFFGQDKGDEHPSFFKETGSCNYFANGAVVQAKLIIGQPDDKYEQEADAMADKVVQKLATPGIASNGEEGIQAKPLVSGITPLVQLKCAHCEEEEKLQKKDDGDSTEDVKLQRKPIFESNAGPPDEESNVQRKCAHCEKEEKLQKKSAPGESASASPDIESSLNSSRGSGESMPYSTRAPMENSFGTDFSGVHIHTDSSAIDMSRNLNAQAFTHGNDIYFNSGKYETNSSDGKRLLAHELTHTIQQGRANGGIALQKDGNKSPAQYDTAQPYSAKFKAIKDFYGVNSNNNSIDYYFIIQGDYVDIYDEKEFQVGLKFNRKSSLDLSGYFLNIRTEKKTFWADTDSWHFVREMSTGYDLVRLIPYAKTYNESNDPSSNVKDEPRYILSRRFFGVINDLSPSIDLTKLSIIKDYNTFNVAVAIVYGTAGTGMKAEPRPEKRFEYSLPSWLSQTEKLVRALHDEARKSNPDDKNLPSRIVFYGSTALQAKEGKDSWLIQIEKNSEKKFIKVNKRDWDKSTDKNEYAKTIYSEIIKKVVEINNARKSAEFDKNKSLENKLKEQKGSKWASLFKLRNSIWDELQKIKKLNPFATNIPDKLTLEFYGTEQAERPVFKIWIEKKDASGRIELKGSALDHEVTEAISLEDWVIFIRTQTEIQKLIESGGDPFDFADFEKTKFGSNAKIQLAPFPAEIIGKNINPDFSTAKGASNKFLMSLNWNAIYHFLDDLSTASRISGVKRYYNFQIIDLPVEIQNKKSAGTSPQELKKDSTEYVNKNNPVRPFDKSTKIKRDNEYEIDMNREGSFLLISYAVVKEEGEKAPRALSSAAHPYFVKDITSMAFGFAEGMDVVGVLRKKLAAEKDPEKRKKLQEQIAEIEKRQAKGYYQQTKEDIADIDKLIDQANQLIEFIKQESRHPAYFGDFEYDPFPIRIRKKRPELETIYGLVKGETNSYTYSDDETKAQQFITSLKSQKTDLGKLSKRVENPEGKFKEGGQRYKAIAAVVNEDNGQIVPVMLLLGEHKDSRPEKKEFKHIIYDVTIDTHKKSDMLYVGEGTEGTEAESVHKAFTKFGEKNNYGDGKAAYRVPVLGYSGLVRSYTTVWEWIEKALLVLALVLLAFGVFISGGALAPATAVVFSGIATALGVSAGVLGAIIGVRNMLDRREKGTLKMDAQTSMDILSIIGAFSGATQAIGKFGGFKISGGLIVVYDLTELGGNAYLIHEKLTEDVAIVKSLGLSKDEERALLKQVADEAGQAGGMLLGAAIGSRLLSGEHVGEGQLDLPKKMREIVENTPYKTYLERGWVDKSGKVTEKAPPYLREAASQGEKTRPAPVGTKDHPQPETPSKPKPAGVPQEPTKIPGEQQNKKPLPSTINKEDGLSERPVHIRNEEHEVVVTKEGIGICSNDPCVVVPVEYKKELAANEQFAQKQKDIENLRKGGNYDEAAEKEALLIHELEAFRAKEKTTTSVPGTKGEDTTPGKEKVPQKEDLPSGEKGKPPTETGTVSKMESKPNTPGARAEANDWELIAADYDKTASGFRKTAEEHQAKAAQLREANRIEEANIADGHAAKANKAADEADAHANAARDEAQRLRGGTEGLSAKQIIDQKELISELKRLQVEIDAKKAITQEKRENAEKAREQLTNRKELLKSLELNRRTPGTRENKLTAKDYQNELNAATASVESAEKRVKAREESLEKASYDQRASENIHEKISKQIHDLETLDRGLSVRDANAKGDFAEAKATDLMVEKGFEHVGGHQDRQGIDGIYRKEGPPLQGIIAEVKYVEDAKVYVNNPERAKRELLNETNDGPQLSELWTKKRVANAVKNNEVMIDEINQSGKYEKWLLIYDAKTRKFLTPIKVE